MKKVKGRKDYVNTRISGPYGPFEILAPAGGIGGSLRSHDCFRTSLLNMFIDLSTPSMKNIEPPAKSKMAARGHKMADGVWKGYWAL